jgi:CRISPR/Cas system-associated exonuclease Cas4 (RecB family)
LKLPSYEIGISDILAYRDCAQRMAFGMRRHVELPERFQLYEGETDDPPEAHSPESAYGSAFHDMAEIVDKEAVSDDEAIDRVWARWQHWLEPADIERFKADLRTYHTRSVLGYRLISAETDMRVPLFKLPTGEWIYFRFKIDALYQSIENPGLFLMRDYKSSRWPKELEAIHNDLQQWSYNFGVFEMFPECETLVQIYDQLRFGEVTIRQKTDEDRKNIRAWLIKQITAILGDEVLRPTQNRWCPWCPLVVECRETVRATEHWRAWLSAVAPREKVGRKIEMTLSQDFSYYVELLPDIIETRKHLEAVEKRLKSDLLALPSVEAEGYDAVKEIRPGKKMPKFRPSVIRELHRELGDDFYQVASVTKKGIEDFYDKDRADEIMERADRVESQPSVVVRDKT